MSSPAHSSVSTTAIIGTNAISSLTTEDFNFPSDLVSMQDRKDEAMMVLKLDVMAALNKEVKSLDEDAWMFEGPRSRINLISTQDGFRQRRPEVPKNWNITMQKLCKFV